MKTLTKKQAKEWIKKFKESLKDLENPKTTGVAIGVNIKSSADLLFNDEIKGAIKFLEQYFGL